jgi:hypothetical protein
MSALSPADPSPAWALTCGASPPTWPARRRRPAISAPNSMIDVSTRCPITVELVHPDPPCRRQLTSVWLPPCVGACCLLADRDLHTAHPLRARARLQRGARVRVAAREAEDGSGAQTSDGLGPTEVSVSRGVFGCPVRAGAARIESSDPSFRQLRLVRYCGLQERRS